jgi:hypothetical protein
MPKLIKSVIRETEVEFFNSIAEAARHHKCNESSIRKVMNKPGRKCCGRSWYTEEVRESGAKILVLDIETAPIRAYVWRLWDQNVGLSQIISNWFMISWAAKWLGEEEAFSAVLTPTEILNEDDERISHGLWDLLDQADIVIAHNGDKFDMPKIRSRFLVNKLLPPSPYKQIDTLRVAQKEFGFASNKLEALATLLGYAGKNSTSFELWAECMKGNAEALEYMRVYNVQDIYVLENVYVALRPYIKGHPNLDLFVDSDESHCPSCGKNTLRVVTDKFFYTQSVRYQVHRCSSCGSLARAKKGIPYKSKKQVSPIPR